MTNVLHPDEKALFHKHHANVVASLNRRLAVAKANHDDTLIELLEQEQKQIAGDTNRASGNLQQQLAELLEDCLTIFRGDSRLQVWQTVDNQGDRWWCAYNPQTGDSVYADSETELRLWIKQNYTADAR